MVEKLSPIKRAALKLLDEVKKIVVDDCSDEELACSLVKLHPSSHDEYINPDDYCYYDEACEILHLGYNRAKLKKLCDDYGIENVTIKNRPMGFEKRKILKLRDILEDESKDKSLKKKWHKRIFS